MDENVEHVPESLAKYLLQGLEFWALTLVNTNVKMVVMTTDNAEKVFITVLDVSAYRETVKNRKPK